MGERGLSVAELETIYTRLAEAIDLAGKEREALLLTKLCLLLAQRLGDASVVGACIDAAELDL